jgi:hypothetical protein
MQVVSESWSEKQMPTDRSTQKCLCVDPHEVGWQRSTPSDSLSGKMSVGKKIFVDKENVGRERFASGVKLLVGKYMSVGKGLCRPDLR